MGPSDFTWGNRVTLFQGESEYVPAMAADIRGARSFVDQAQFVFEPSGSGVEIVDAMTQPRPGRPILQRLFKDGVGSSPTVNALADGFDGSLLRRIGERRRAAAAMLGELQGAGVEVATNHRLSWLGPRAVDHRKNMGVDGRIAWNGGAGFSERFRTWNDYMLRIEGPAAADVTRQMQSRWQSVHGGAPYPVPATGAVDGANAGVRFLVNDPGRGVHPATEGLLELLEGAERRIYLQSQLISDDGLADVLIEARRRNVDVQVFGNRPEGGLLRRPLDAGLQVANGAVREQLVSAGVAVFDQEQFNHGKMWLIDDDVVIGSLTASRRALKSNVESISIVRDAPELLAHVEGVFARDALTATRVTPEAVSTTGYKLLRGLAKVLPIRY